MIASIGSWLLAAGGKRLLTFSILCHGRLDPFVGVQLPETSVGELIPDDGTGVEARDSCDGEYVPSECGVSALDFSSCSGSLTPLSVAFPSIPDHDIRLERVLASSTAERTPKAASIKIGTQGVLRTGFCCTHGWAADSEYAVDPRSNQLSIEQANDGRQRASNSSC